MIVLIILIAVVYTIPEFIPEEKPYFLDTGADSLFQVIESRNKKLAAENEPDKIDKSERVTSQPNHFTFDPNTLSEAGWKSLGVREKTIKTILNFRSKGGRFRHPSDIRKIYGLSEQQADQLVPYIRIMNPVDIQKHQKFTLPTDSPVLRSFHKKNRVIQTVEINSADSVQFVALPGIGARLASRILAFRNRLGGFHSINQIAETYGVTDSTFDLIKQYLLCDPSMQRKINLNTADLTILKNHPYIKWSLANAIVRYRQQHGTFSSVRDLLKIEIINEEIYNKIAPYLVIE